MKRIFVLLITLVLLLSLAGCGSETMTEPTPEPAPEPTPEPIPISQAETYCIELEYGRLYLQGKDELEYPTLTVDSYCHGYDHRGNNVVAAFADNTIRRFDLTDGTSEILVEGMEKYVPRIRHYCSDGFIFTTYDMNDGANVYRWHNGETKLLVENTFKIFDLYISDGAILYQDYEGSNDTTYLVALNIADGTERWRVSGGSYFGIVLVQDDTVYVVDENKQLYRVEMSDDSFVPVYTSFDTERFEVLAMGSNGSFLLYDYGWMSGEPGVYYADEDGIRLLDWIPTDAESSYATKLDKVGDKVLVRSYQINEAPEPNHYGEKYSYTSYFYHLVDMTDGSCANLFVPHGENARMFEHGDFPVLDSSTARKPVAWDIFRLFCEDGAIPGYTPVCNTTHGAWIALADRMTDIALLAAPTEEEQAYLEEQGTEVEMKLYGGDGLVFIGNKACGVDDLTLGQIRGIYRGWYTNWSELGGVDAPIRVLYRDSQSGSQRLIEKMLWGDEPVPDYESLGFERLDEMNTIVNECLYSPYTIGYSIMTYLNDIYGEEDLLAFTLDGVEAKPENIANGTYPLSTKGYVVIRAGKGLDWPARRLYDWFGSPMCDEILRNNGVTPIHGKP